MKNTQSRLAKLLDSYDGAQEALRIAQSRAWDFKMALTQHALDNNMVDCLTINVSKLKQRSRQQTDTYVAMTSSD